MQGETIFPAGANLSSVTILMGPQSLSNIWMASVHLPDSTLQHCAGVRPTSVLCFEAQDVTSVYKLGIFRLIHELTEENLSSTILLNY